MKKTVDTTPAFGRPSSSGKGNLGRRLAWRGVVVSSWTKGSRNSCTFLTGTSLPWHDEGGRVYFVIESDQTVLRGGPGEAMIKSGPGQHWTGRNSPKTPLDVQTELECAL